MFRDRAIRSATLATFIALLILLALGAWQIQRLHWKEGILAQIDAAEARPPLPLGATPLPFAKVVATGVLMQPSALYGVDVHDEPDGRSRLGAQLLRILQRPGQAPLLVDLGWVPEGAPAPAVTGTPQSIAGYVRAGDKPGMFSPEDDVDARHFYTLDPAVIGPSLGAEHPAPFTLVAMGPPGGVNDPLPATELPRPPNNHLQYAFTWFGLAAALVGVFAAWVRGKRTASQ